jgi:large subunit ribosomal protein L11
MAKKVAGQLKLQVPAGSANPSPPIGPRTWSARHQHHGILQGLQRGTQEQEKGMPIPVVITYFQDKSFTFAMKQPPVSYFLKKEAKLKSGSKTPGQGKGRHDHARPGPHHR